MKGFENQNKIFGLYLKAMGSHQGFGADNGGITCIEGLL